MNKKFSWILGVALSIIIGQLTFVNVNAESVMKMCNCGKYVEKIVGSLQLTDAQKMQITAIKADVKLKTMMDKKKLHTIRMQIRNIIVADKLNKIKLDALINQSKNLIGNIMRIKIIARHKMYALLDAQQKVEFKSMIQKWVHGQHD